MYLWDIKALARQLGSNAISESKGMQYFLVASLLVLFGTYYSLWWGAVRDWLFYFELLVVAIITIFGCREAFDANGANDGKSFVLRAICISVPAGNKSKRT